ncbi:hypothetical protein FPY71_17605 [Aureimonas fodinaquatilis]|uniref:Uncharacterized protein n=1 Tax=Aureimonas fodinaquatilis TaxID=2565783 RepID=A0A5B0DNX2_9HYPH|nr:hypothetical protein [Aureimonas fodinaquatilis]KAA0968146.1 hypothetical protein FPY71_17605 [Aureimonas fodinaquatilis]
MNHFAKGMIWLFLGVGVVPALSSEAVRPNEPLRVGKTNIHCVKEPCPWLGVVQAGATSNGPAGLLWSSQTLPELVANPEDAQNLSAAWADGQCVLITGRLENSVLHVGEIVGNCP